jgi:hypothetical protein
MGIGKTGFPAVASLIEVWQRETDVSLLRPPQSRVAAGASERGVLDRST